MDGVRLFFVQESRGTIFLVGVGLGVVGVGGGLGRGGFVWGGVSLYLINFP